MEVGDDLQFEAAAGVIIEPGCRVGHAYPGWAEPARLGSDCVIRTGTIIYADTVLGERTVTGVRTFIREHTVLGARCLVGTDTVIDGRVQAGDDVILQGGVYIPTHVVIGDRVFIGPRAVLTNDRYPLRRRDAYAPQGPVIEDDVTIGANATVLPGLKIGRGAMVAAGAVVTIDVPEWSLAVGVPARIRDLPPELHEGNTMRRRT
jgi:acetyltransferase-like isoleucine patch superfamily enzyme